MLRLIGAIGDRYQVEDLAQKYPFHGQESLDIPGAIEIKEMLETIDRLLQQIEEAAKTAQIGIIDREALSQFAEPEDIDNLSEMEKQIQNLVKRLAEEQGLLESQKGGLNSPPKPIGCFNRNCFPKYLAI